jgi:hypothetical protein
MTRDQIVKVLDDAVALHNETMRYYEGHDYLGEIEFYIPKFNEEGEYRGLGREIELDWSAIGLGPALV